MSGGGRERARPTKNTADVYTEREQERQADRWTYRYTEIEAHTKTDPRGETKARTNGWTSTEREAQKRRGEIDSGRRRAREGENSPIHSSRENGARR